MSYRNIRFNVISQPTQIWGDSSEGYSVTMRAVLETYAVSSSMGREELFDRDDIRTYGSGSSEATALANAQFKFQQELENYQQKRRAGFNIPSYPSRSSSSSSSSNGNISAGGILFLIVGLPLTGIISIAVMRSVFSNVFRTRGLLPTNADDWFGTIIFALIPIPFGWVAWLTTLIVGFVFSMLFVTLFPAKEDSD